MQQEHHRTPPNTLNLIVDVAVFTAFLIIMAPHSSGVAIHEWLSIAFGAAVVAHLLLHWQWLAELTRRFLGRTQWSMRVNYILNALLFIDMTVIIFTGLMISEAVLPLFGLHLAARGAWRRLHDISANLSILLIGLHVALHWQWIVGVARRLAGAPRRRRAPHLGAAPDRREV